MNKQFFYDILDKERQDILPLLKEFRKDFYLAGGTALALHIGHRDSVDFDFFSVEDFDKVKLFENILNIFSGHDIKKTQEARGTLSVLIDSKIKLSFFSYPYSLISDVLEDDNFRLASIADIGCMKLLAIVSRGVLKDYVDLYFILQKTLLYELLNFTKKKFPQIDTSLILKSLVFFEDLEEEPINFKHNMQVDFPKVKEFLAQKVKEYINKKEKTDG